MRGLHLFNKKGYIYLFGISLIAVSFPSVVLETSEDEVTEYYSPKDLIVGTTVFVLSRRFLIVDCDKFTRKYYQYDFFHIK